MADDIDIEEHDVLDNPRIKNIFPDLTCIKTEVIDYDEENLEVEDHEINNFQYESGLPDDFEIPSLYQNKIILGTKPCTSSDTSDGEQEEEEKEIFVPKLEDTSVVLEDWGVILASSPCYCESCKILFATVNALDSHKMSVHSFLVAVTTNRNVAIKSTSKNSLSARLKFETDETDNHCNHCNKVFPDEIALLKHSYELLPVRKFECEFCDSIFDSERALNDHKVTHTMFECLLCPICSCHFKFARKFTSHVINCHKTDIVVPDPAKTEYKCIFCNEKKLSNKSYNGHIQYRHASYYYKKPNDNIDKYKCQPCNLTFPTAYSERIHKVAKHTDTKDRISNVVRQSVGQLNVDKIVSLKKYLPEPNAMTRPIPKSTLFKCNKCQLHFVSCSVAIEHMKRCVLKKGDWKCKKCRRSFKLVDRQPHLRQHELTDRFKVIKVYEDIGNKILWKCTKCQVGFDEGTLLKYHTTGCMDTNSVSCSLCELRIHVYAITRHNRFHSELDTDQFIFVDFVCIDDQKSINSSIEPLQSDREVVTVRPGTSTSKRVNKKDKFYYYCPTCQCFMKVSKKCDKHDVGKCNKHLQKILCKMCGLRFSVKSFNTHKKEHKKFPNLKLRNLTFRNTQSGKKIDPPFPEFKMCEYCGVRFFSSVALKNHLCNVEDAKTCVYCEEKFSDLAYKIHVAFHEYSGSEKKVFNENIPELIKKYESLKTVWNILYYCTTCDTVLDSYDDAVEHCQDHFCNMESYNVTIKNCSICDLNFVGQCYEKHKKLHSANSITKTSFQILSYSYESLLADNWYDIFKSITKAQVDQILAKSKYKHTRSVRIDVLVDGPIDMTLYKCGACNIIIDRNAVFDHAKDRRNCNNSIKYNCSICKLKFQSKNSLTSHGYIHLSQNTGITPRILSFNNDKDAYVNDSIRSKMINPEGLKFIRCQHCGKLINKAKYKKHIEYHKYYKPRKAYKLPQSNSYMKQPKFLTRPKFKKIIHSSKVYNFYKCKKCNVCLFKHNINKHFCSSASHKTQCRKCLLWFRSSHLRRHLVYHEKYKLRKDNLNVFVFKDGKIEKEKSRLESSKDKILLYQCVDCSVCLHQRMNLRRHSCMSEGYKRTCDVCEVLFHCTSYRIHEKLHEIKSFSRQDLTIFKFKDKKVLNEAAKRERVKSKKTISLKPSLEDTQTRTNRVAKKYNVFTDLLQGIERQDFVRHVHDRIYKCIKCKLLFVTPWGLIKHQNSCNNDSVGVKCGKCGLVYHDTMIDLHDLITTCSFKMRPYYFLTVEFKDGLEYDERKFLYTCQNCEIYYLTFRAIYRHFEVNHMIKFKNTKCDICGIVLTALSYHRHKHLQHSTGDNLSASDFIHFKVSSMTLQKALNNLPDEKLIGHTYVTKTREEMLKNDSNLSIDPIIETTDANISCSEINEKPEVKVDIKNHAVKRKTSVEEPIAPKRISRRIIEAAQELDDSINNSYTNINFSNEIYSCDICKLNFLHRRTLQLHISKGKHGDHTKYKCQICGLDFTQNSLTRHLKIHQENPDYCSVKQNVNTKVIQDTTDMEKTKHSSDQTSRLSQTNPSTITQHLNNNQTSNKLYKCNNCDVYFYTQDACNEHVQNHEPLDPTEYIACKICDLQFLCEYLGTHMRSHREKTFDMDNLIVEEYQLVDGKINVDKYSAADRLKSKLVSTTTHFDTEDEKVDKDDSTVDSTVSTDIKMNYADSLASNQSDK